VGRDQVPVLFPNAHRLLQRQLLLIDDLARHGIDDHIDFQLGRV
jgi:hypothetical protein